MIELIEGLPDDVVGFEAVGVVTSNDYDDVVRPAVERALEAHDKIRLLHVLGDRLEHHTAGALWDDAKVGQHLRSFERIAVVTDLEAIRMLVKAGGWSVPGELELFANAERAAAIAWITADLGEPTTAEKRAGATRRPNGSEAEGGVR